MVLTFQFPLTGEAVSYCYEVVSKDLALPTYVPAYIVHRYEYVLSCQKCIRFYGSAWNAILGVGGLNKSHRGGAANNQRGKP